MKTAQEKLDEHQQAMMRARDDARRLRDECNAKRREFRAAEILYQKLRFRVTDMIRAAEAEKKLAKGACVPVALKVEE